jgi:aryl-alcohol dehydrogenase-like predicted oxidoreductase
VSYTFRGLYVYDTFVHPAERLVGVFYLKRFEWLSSKMLCLLMGDNQNSRPDRMLDAGQSRDDAERTWRILEVMAPIAKAHECSPARLSLAWLLAKPVVTSVIIGAKRLDTSFRINLAAVELTLTQDELRQNHCTKIKCSSN